MPRIRTVKPEIHQDEAIGELSDSAFRLFIGLITQADDLGRLRGDPRLVGAQVWPYRPKTVAEIAAWLEELEDGGLIVRYSHKGRAFICLPSWGTHQRIDNASKSRIPAPNEEGEEVSPRDSASRGGSPLDQGREGKGSRKGRESVADAPDAPLSELLADLIAGNDPNGKRPTVSLAWVQAEDRMLRLDKRDPKEAERLIRWTQNHDFWCGNVRSMPKFREQYGRLHHEAMKRSKARPAALAGKQGTNPEEARLKKALADRTAREEAQGVAA
jgi:hypothetical protein